MSQNKILLQDIVLTTLFNLYLVWFFVLRHTIFMEITAKYVLLPDKVCTTPVG